MPALPVTRGRVHCFMAPVPGTTSEPTISNEETLAFRSRVWIAMDVVDLDRTEAFYARLLGARRMETRRDGQLMSERLLVCDRVPGLGLHLREAFGIRVGGSQPGHLLRVSVAHPDLPEVIRSLGPQTAWIGPAPDPASPPPSIRLLDPDAYEVELFAQRPAWIV